MREKKLTPVAMKNLKPAAEVKPRPVAARYMPNPKECALLLLRLIQTKEEESGRPLSRFRVAEITLKRMWGRHRLTPEFITDVNEWLLRAGRTLFYAGGSYGVILVSAVESWSRLTSKRIAPEIEKALGGTYEFLALEELLSEATDDSEEAN
jgi:hypothetical protein